jgi:hypothetical protein
MRYYSNRGSQNGNEERRLLISDQGIVFSISKASEICDNTAIKSHSTSSKIEQAGCSRSTERAKADEPACQTISSNPKIHSGAAIGHESPIALAAKMTLA